MGKIDNDRIDWLEKHYDAIVTERDQEISTLEQTHEQAKDRVTESKAEVAGSEELVQTLRLEMSDQNRRSNKLIPRLIDAIVPKIARSPEPPPHGRSGVPGAGNHWHSRQRC